MDGKHSYSKVVQIKIGKNTWVSSIVNPVGNTISILVYAEKPGILSARIIDMQGRVILKNTQSLSRGNSGARFPATQLAKGVYLLELVQDGKRMVTKLMKE